MIFIQSPLKLQIP